MSKLGKQFQLVVADVVREMDPDSTVREGEWIKGPDGQRDIDVVVEGTVGSVVRRVQIECRDYSSEGRPIGIGAIDALESKHRDLGMDVSFMCSNAGFTRDAVRKASRVGIGLIGVLREGDPRIRYQVVDEIYVRRVECVPKSAEVKIKWFGSAPKGNLRLEEVTYEGIPVFNWLSSRIPIFLGANPVVKGIHLLSYKFKHPVQFVLPSGSAPASSIRIQFEVTGGWFAITTEIDATTGLYDWMRKVIRLGPGGGRIVFKDVPIGEGGDPIRCPPGFDPEKPFALADGESFISVLDLGGYNPPERIPDLDGLVVDEDLVPVRGDVAPGSCYS